MRLLTSRRSLAIVWAVLLVSLIGGAVWWVNRGTDDNGVAPKTSVAQDGAAESPGRVPVEWETIDATPGFDRWARRVKDPWTGIVFILVEPGRFMMGSPDGEGHDDEHPQHEVRITKPYYLAETETTVAQWRRFVEATGHENKGGNWKDAQPINFITWEDAKAFCDHYDYRLPTEAEWEYASRAGTTGPRYGNVDEIAWHEGNSERWCHPVREKKPNPWGFHDMLGNLSEWCADAYDKDSYRKDVRDDPFVRDGSVRVVRGGSFSWNRAFEPLRCSYRDWRAPRHRQADIGFRCAKSP